MTQQTVSHDGRDWDVLVAVPDAGVTKSLAGPGPYPVLYVVDPSVTFLNTSSTARTLLALSAGTLAPIAVVGVGPHTDNVGELMMQRVRDLTPTRHDDPKLPGSAVSGGAELLLDFIIDTIAPQVENEHNLDGSRRAIGGWSLGGLLTCTALLRRPQAFSRFLAVSPSLWWDSSVLMAEATALPSGALAGKELYLAVGEHESADLDVIWPPLPEDAKAAIRAGGATPDMVGDAASFAEILSGTGVTLTHEVIADEQHNRIWAAAVTRGLVNLFSYA